MKKHKKNVVGYPSKHTDYIITHKLGYPPLCKSEYNTNFTKCQVERFIILAFAYRVYNAKWQNIILNLDNDVEEERLSRICFQLMFAMDSYYEKRLITLTAISDYEIYKATYSYTLDLLEKINRI